MVHLLPLISLLLVVLLSPSRRVPTRVSRAAALVSALLAGGVAVGVASGVTALIAALAAGVVLATVIAPHAPAARSLAAGALVGVVVASFLGTDGTSSTMALLALGASGAAVGHAAVALGARSEDDIWTMCVAIASVLGGACLAVLASGVPVDFMLRVPVVGSESDVAQLVATTAGSIGSVPLRVPVATVLLLWAAATAALPAVIVSAVRSGTLTPASRRVSSLFTFLAGLLFATSAWMLHAGSPGLELIATGDLELLRPASIPGSSELSVWPEADLAIAPAIVSLAAACAAFLVVLGVHALRAGPKEGRPVAYTMWPSVVWFTLASMLFAETSVANAQPAWSVGGPALFAIAAAAGTAGMELQIRLPRALRNRITALVVLSFAFALFWMTSLGLMEFS